ncbi:OmpW family outer membrane protein [Robbsia sp. KACC 23696]|uniref:OmpW/AlkL family protein n=1 Tax=Robbsia sp. KACC 23696 TaxID=3149231 RepID=UPI00325A4CBE
MKIRQACAFATLSACACAVSTTASAQSAGSFTINAGWFHLAPQDSSRPLSVSALGQTATVPNTGATISNADTAGLTLGYFITDHISVEGVFGYPPKMRLYGEGNLSPLGKLGTANEWSPTLLVKYNFFKPEAKFRPYLGAGVSYVWYSNVKLSQQMSNGAFLAARSPLLVGKTNADLSSSFAPVLNAGLTYNINKHWSIGASVSYLFLSTNATLTTQSAVGTVTSKTRLKIDPIVTFLSVGYTF